MVRIRSGQGAVSSSDLASSKMASVGRTRGLLKAHSGLGMTLRRSNGQGSRSAMIST